MAEVFQGVNSRVTKISSQGELPGGTLNNIVRNTKNIISIEISEPPYPPYKDSIIELSTFILIEDIGDVELGTQTNVTNTIVSAEIYERELTKGNPLLEITETKALIEIEQPMRNVVRNTKNIINIEISAPPYPPYNDPIAETSNAPLIIDIYEPPLWIENTIYYGDIPITKIFYGDIPITKVYKGDVLIAEFDIE